MKNNLYNKKIKETESIINFDYSLNNVSIYSSRNATIKKLFNLLGNPTRVNYVDNNKIYDAEWVIPFSDRFRIRKILSIQLYVLNK